MVCTLALGLIFGCDKKPEHSVSTSPAPKEEPIPAGVPRTWLEPARAGDIDAQYHLGLLLYFGYKEPKSQDEAMDMFRRASEKKLAGKPQVLEINYRRQDGVTFNADEGLKWLRKAGEGGHVLAQYHLGDIYFSGKGVPMDFAEGLRWFIKAGENGNSWAQYFLGSQYAEGKSVTANPTEADRWYRYAAERGNIHAQYDFGHRLSTGDGVPKNLQESLHWLRKAAETDHQWAQFNLGALLSENAENPEDRDYDEAAKWFHLSAEQGNPESQYMLAKLHSRGRGVERDYFEAYKWVKLALMSRNEKYYHELRALVEPRLSPEQLARANEWCNAFVARKTRASL